MHRFFSLCAVAILTTSTRADDWPRWRGPDLNGISREKNWSVHWPKEGPRQLWKQSVGVGFSSVAVADGRVFTIGNARATDTVFCFDAETGKELWKYSYPCELDAVYYEGGPGSTPTLESGRVYTLSKRGHLFCFDAATGKVLWQKNLMTELGVEKPRWGFAGSPLIEGDLLILNLGDAGTAIDKHSGKIVWTSGKTPSGYATPIPITVNAERQLAIFSAKALVAVRLSDGAPRWRHSWETRWDINAADPIVVDGRRLFVSTFDRGCALLDVGAESPRVIWQNKNIANHFNSGVLINGHVYGVHGNTDQAERDLRCLDVNTGELKWKFTGLGLGSLIAANDHLIVLSDRGELVLAPANPQGFKPIARAQVLGGKCWTPPALANGRIYCRNAAGTLVCVDVAGGR